MRLILQRTVCGEPSFRVWKASMRQQLLGFEAKSYPWLGSWQHWCNIYINRVKSDTAKTFQILTYYWWGQRFLESCHPRECINGQTWIRIFTGGRQKGERVARMGWEQQSGKISDCYGIWTSLSLSFRLYVCVVCVCVCVCVCVYACVRVCVCILGTESSQASFTQSQISPLEQ